MAPRLSFAQDTFGYFNGAQNFRFIPQVDPFQIQNNLPVANRTQNFTYAVKGTLSKITYPTGGYSNFTYEAHSSQLGGVRIKEVDTYDPVSQVTITKNYVYGGAAQKFSPTYVYTEEHQNNVFSNSGGLCIAILPPQMCTYVFLTSNSLTPLSGRGSYYVYYSQVTETDGVNGANGGIEHYFNQTSGNSMNPLTQWQGQHIYGITAPMYNWQWAEETNTNYYKMVSGSKVYVKKIANTWTNDSRENTTYTEYALKQEDFKGILTPPPGTDNPWNDQQYTLSAYDVISYTHQQQWNYISSTTTTDYDLNGANPIAKTVNYYYDNPAHALVTRTQTADSKGETLLQVDKYVGDQASVSNLTPNETIAIDSLQNEYRIATLLERDENNNGVLMNRIHNSYFLWFDIHANHAVLPQAFRTQIGSNPMETRLSYQNYDLTNGNLLQYAKTTGPSVAYQWGYNLQYPVAEVKNAPNNDIFFDSFEEGNGNSYYNDAKTGHYSYNGTPAYSKLLSGLDNGNYTLTYWQNSAGAWSLNTSSVAVTTGTYTIGLTGQIDDVRFYPADAQMTTYTYDPLIGLTTETDAKNEISYYEYDNSERLLNVKDKDGNIVKSYCYNYAGEPYGCNITPLSQPQKTFSFTLTNLTGVAGFVATFSEGSTVYPFTLNTNTTSLIAQLPAGSYTLVINPIDAPTQRKFLLGSRLPVTSQGVTFNSVTVGVTGTETPLIIENP